MIHVFCYEIDCENTEVIAVLEGPPTTQEQLDKLLLDYKTELYSMYPIPGNPHALLTSEENHTFHLELFKLQVKHGLISEDAGFWPGYQESKKFGEGFVYYKLHPERTPGWGDYNPTFEAERKAFIDKHDAEVHEPKRQMIAKAHASMTERYGDSGFTVYVASKTDLKPVPFVALNAGER